MGILTAALYAVLLAYLGGWFLGHWTGNFSLLLFVLTLATFLYWLAERLRFRPAREAAAARLDRETAERRQALQRQGIEKVDGLDTTEAKQRLLEP